jgi:hypothetical protein
VTREEDDGRREAPRLDGLHQLEPAQPGHPEVGDDEGDGGRLEEVERLEAVLRGHGEITLGLQELAQGLPGRGLVVDDQDLAPPLSHGYSLNGR